MAFELTEVFRVQRRFLRVLVFFIQFSMECADFFYRFKRIRLRGCAKTAKAEKDERDIFHGKDNVIAKIREMVAINHSDEKTFQLDIVYSGCSRTMELPSFLSAFYISEDNFRNTSKTIIIRITNRRDSPIITENEPNSSPMPSAEIVWISFSSQI